MGVGSGAKRLEPAQQYGGVPVRAVTFEDVLEARWDITTSQLLEGVIRPDEAFEVSLAKIDMGLVRFRSRAYRYAASLGLQAHVVKTSNKSVIRIYSHAATSTCDLCKPQRDVAG